MKKVTSLLFAASLAFIAITGCGNSMNPAPLAPTTQVTESSKPPVVLSTGGNSRVFVRFNHDMDVSTINPQNLSINGVTSNVSYDATSRIAYLTPTTTLAAAATYNTTVTKDVRDMKGVNMPASYNFAFKSAPAVDTTPPTVIAVDTGCVAASGPIHATFSEEMDSSTITGSTFIVDGVLGTVTYDPATRIASFTPSSPLTPGATYNVTITSGVTDLAGNHLGADLPYGGQDFSWTITVCTTPPPVSFCSYSKGGYSGPGAPGQLFANNFTTVFSSGLTIGINDDAGSQHDDLWTGDSTGQSSLTAFLTSPAGGTSTALTTDAVNPTATDSGDLAEQTAALTLNIGFSGTGGDPAGFGGLVLHDTGGSLDGSTVSEVLAAANGALAGNGLPLGYSFGDLNTLLMNINQSWDNCTQSDWGAAHLK